MPCARQTHPEAPDDSRLRVLDPEVGFTVDTPGDVAVVLGATEVAAGAQPSAAVAARS
jgi:hypothetical protein